MSILYFNDLNEIFKCSISKNLIIHQKFYYEIKYFYLDQNKKLSIEEGSDKKMNYFLLTKYNAVEENVLFTAKTLYELLGPKDKHIDQLFLEFSHKQEIAINLNIERILYLALTFLFSLEKIKINKNMIEKIENEV